VLYVCFLRVGTGHAVFFGLLLPLLCRRRGSPEEKMLWRLNYLWCVWRVYMAFAACTSVAAIVANGSCSGGVCSYAVHAHPELYSIAVQGGLLSIVRGHRAHTWVGSHGV
jgi:hypothetical protein